MDLLTLYAPDPLTLILVALSTLCIKPLRGWSRFCTRPIRNWLNNIRAERHMEDLFHSLPSNLQQTLRNSSSLGRLNDLTYDAMLGDPDMETLRTLALCLQERQDGSTLLTKWYERSGEIQAFYSNKN